MSTSNHFPNLSDYQYRIKMSQNNDGNNCTDRKKIQFKIITRINIFKFYMQNIKPIITQKAENTRKKWRQCISSNLYFPFTVLFMQNTCLIARSIAKQFRIFVNIFSLQYFCSCEIFKSLLPILKE